MIEQPKGRFSQDAGFAEILTRRKDDYIRHYRNEKETGTATGNKLANSWMARPQ